MGVKALQTQKNTVAVLKNKNISVKSCLRQIHFVSKTLHDVTLSCGGILCKVRVTCNKYTYIIMA